MHCAPCRKWATTHKQQQLPFVQGTKLFKLDSIKKHEQSVGHKDFAGLKKADPSCFRFFNIEEEEEGGGGESSPWLAVERI